jgi:hypothetical protein
MQDRDLWNGTVSELEKWAKRSIEGEEMVELPPPDMFSRYMGGAVGTGLVAAQTPLLSRYTKGRGTFYHGTPLATAAAILKDPKGIDPERAGLTHLKGELVKARRFNANILADSAIRTLEEHGVDLPRDSKIRAIDKFEQAMDAGKSARDAAKKVFSEETKALQLSSAEKKSLLSKMEKGLSRFGLRSYYASSPGMAVIWGGAESELGQMAQHQMRKDPRPGVAMAKSIGHMMTGGIPSIAHDVYKEVKHKPEEVVKMTRREATDYVQRLSDAGKRLKAVIGVDKPTAGMGYLEDYPGVKHFLNINPGLKHQLRDVGIQTYEPGRDISFATETKPKHFKTIDLIDEATNKFKKRIQITDYEKAVASPIAKRLRKAVMPLTLGGLGAYGVYRAVKPRKIMVPATSPEGIEAKTPKTELKELRQYIDPGYLFKAFKKEKKATVASDMWRISKYVLPTAAVGTAAGIGVSKGMEKLIPPAKTPPRTLPEKGLEISKDIARATGRSLGYIAPAAAAGAAVGGWKGGIVGAPLGAGVGMYLSNLFEAPAGEGREMGKAPTRDPFLGVMPQKAQTFIRQHPWLGGVYGGAVGAGIPLGMAYMARRYYPGHFAKMQRTVGQFAEEVPEMLQQTKRVRQAQKAAKDIGREFPELAELGF